MQAGKYTNDTGDRLDTRETERERWQSKNKQTNKQIQIQIQLQLPECSFGVEETSTVGKTALLRVENLAKVTNVHTLAVQHLTDGHLTKCIRLTRLRHRPVQFFCTAWDQCLEHVPCGVQHVLVVLCHQWIVAHETAERIRTQLFGIGTHQLRTQQLIEMRVETSQRRVGLLL
jgi:hypothetical protein